MAPDDKGPHTFARTHLGSRLIRHKEPIQPWIESSARAVHLGRKHSWANPKALLGCSEGFVSPLNSVGLVGLTMVCYGGL